jgi:hypothetical protein
VPGAGTPLPARLAVYGAKNSTPWELAPGLRDRRGVGLRFSDFGQ